MAAWVSPAMISVAIVLFDNRDQVGLSLWSAAFKTYPADHNLIKLWAHFAGCFGPRLAFRQPPVMLLQ